jgi:predicted transcriptional regulator
MSRRIKLEIYLDVLGTIKSGVEKPTGIMSRANLSWRPLQSVLGGLLSEGFVDVIDLTGVRGRDKRSSRCYRLTGRGEVAFRCFSEARDLLSP